MPRFIDCDDGWVNLDYVTKICWQECSDPGLLFYGPDGRTIGKKTDRQGLFNLEEALASVVPAAAGATAVVISLVSKSRDGRPEGTYVVRAPIVAWRLSDTPVPVLIEEPSSDEAVLVVMPDGRVMAPYNGTFDTVADAEAAILERAQHFWDRQCAAQKVPAK